jgi:hypothetical protein
MSGARYYKGRPVDRGDVWARLLALSVLDPLSGCWLWIGATVVNRRGRRYGVLKVNGKQVLAHREAWKQVHGRSMPKRKHGAHSCDETLCICPDHVRGATPSANQKEAYRKGRKVAGFVIAREREMS